MYGFHVPARLATRISLCLLLMEFLSLSVARTYAQTDTVWQPVNGAWYGNWSDPSHWTNGVPNGNFNAYISNGSGGQATVHMDVPGVSVVNLTLDAGDLLDNSTGGPMFITGSLKNGGWFQLFPSSSLIDSGDVANVSDGMSPFNGLISLYGSAVLTMGGNFTDGPGSKVILYLANDVMTVREKSIIFRAPEFPSASSVASITKCRLANSITRGWLRFSPETNSLRPMVITRKPQGCQT